MLCRKLFPKLGVLILKCYLNPVTPSSKCPFSLSIVIAVGTISLVLAQVNEVGQFLTSVLYDKPFLRH